MSHGFERRYYQRIEAGEVNLSLKSLNKLAKAFRVTITELMHVDKTSAYSALSRSNHSEAASRNAGIAYMLDSAMLRFTRSPEPPDRIP